MIAIGDIRLVDKILLPHILLTVLILPVLAADGVIPPEIVNYSKDWPLPNKDYSNTRAAADSGINSSNIL